MMWIAVVVIGLVVLVALMASMANSAASATQAAAALEAARAAQTANQVNLGLVALVGVLGLVVVGLAAALVWTRRQRRTEDEGRWQPGPNARWGRTGTTISPGPPEGWRGGQLDATQALTLAILAKMAGVTPPPPPLPPMGQERARALPPGETEGSRDEVWWKEW